MYDYYVIIYELCSRIDNNYTRSQYLHEKYMTFNSDLSNENTSYRSR